MGKLWSNILSKRSKISKHVFIFLIVTFFYACETWWNINGDKEKMTCYESYLNNYMNIHIYRFQKIECTEAE